MTPAPQREIQSLSAWHRTGKASYCYYDVSAYIRCTGNLLAIGNERGGGIESTNVSQSHLLPLQPSSLHLIAGITDPRWIWNEVAWVMCSWGWRRAPGRWNGSENQLTTHLNHLCKQIASYNSLPTPKQDNIPTNLKNLLVISKLYIISW